MKHALEPIGIFHVGMNGKHALQPICIFHVGMNEIWLLDLKICLLDPSFDVVSLGVIIG